MRRIGHSALCTLLAFAVLGCPGPRIVIEEPRDGLIVDDPAPQIPVAARMPPAFDPTTIEVRLDGVDLIDALGLVPPFADEGGVVLVAGEPVGVSAFSFTTGNPQRVELELSDLPAGPHEIEVFGTKTGGASQLRSAAEGVLAHAAVGASLAGAPVPLADGGELRAGFAPAAEARIQGANP